MRQMGRGAIGIATLCLVGLVAVPAAAQANSCNGQAATISGTRHRDLLVGTAGDDVIAGNDGSDVIKGRGGNDVICGDDGYDDVWAGPGEDYVEGGDAIDFVRGDAGDDTLEILDSDAYRYGTDILYGGGGHDTLEGNDAPNILRGGPGDDVVRGRGARFSDCDCETQFDEILDGGLGNDQLTGGTMSGANIGYQIFSGGPGDDRMDANNIDIPAVVPDDYFYGHGDVLDLEEATGPMHVDLAAGTSTGEGTDTMAGINHVYGSDFGDTILGDADQNYLTAGWGFGDDVVDGRGNDDIVSGGTNGADTLSGGDGNDQLYGGSGDDTLDGGPGEADDADGGPGTDACPNSEVTDDCES